MPTPQARVDLETVLRNNQTVYVRNMTKPRGTLMLSFVLGNGKTHGVRIPRTLIPIALNDFVPRDVIERSHDLREYLRKRILELVPAAIAEKELADPKNRDELEALRTSEFSSTSTFVSSRVTDMQKAVDNATPDQLEVQGVQTTAISPRVLSLMLRVEAGDQQIKPALIDLRNMEDELTPTDCNYIIATGPEGQLKDFAKARLASFSTSSVIKTNSGAVMAGSEPLGPDDDSDLTPEEKAVEAANEAKARAKQAIGK